MDSHKNARLTALSRELLARRVIDQGVTLKQAASRLPVAPIGRRRIAYSESILLPSRPLGWIDERHIGQHSLAAEAHTHVKPLTDN
jgi:hypothetical protein